MSNSDTNLTPLVACVSIRLVESGSDGLLAWASCVVSGAIKLDNIAIRRGRDGSLFLTYPAKHTTGGGKHHYFNPISAEAAQAVQDALLTRLVALAKVESPAAHGGAQQP